MARALVLLLLTLTLPRPAHAWGFEAHRVIADQAINLLPAELQALFVARRAFIVDRSIDPDLWRTLGWLEEPPNHFLNFDYAAYGPDPFDGLPRDYASAVQKFGKDTVTGQGLLPWRVQEYYGRLQRAFAALNGQSVPPYTLNDIVLFSAVLAHYVSDGHVPLHAVVNYDGQLTQQDGLHSRWETELFERNRGRLRIAPVAPVPTINPRDEMFATLLVSNRLAASVLHADRVAAAGRDVYDNAYFDAFRTDTWGVLERRVNDSISAVAGVIIGAWEQAGRPTVPADFPRTPRPIRRPVP